MSKVMVDPCRLLQVKHLRTSIYHPQMDGLVECFNQTLKLMLKWVVDKVGRNSDLLLPYVFFTIQESPQASIGFTAFRLLFGWCPLGLLDLAREAGRCSPHHSAQSVTSSKTCRSGSTK